MTEDLKQQLWNYLDRQRVQVNNKSESENLSGWLEGGHDFRERRERLLIWLKNASGKNSKDGGEYISTGEIASFMAEISGLGTPHSILDPVCGSGLLLGITADLTGSSVVQGVEINQSVFDTAKLLLPDTTQLMRGDALDPSLSLREEYDLIVADPPFGLRMRVPFVLPELSQPLNVFSDALLCWSAAKLSAQGMMVFLLPASHLSGKTEKVWDYLALHGIHRRASIHIPSGQLHRTAVESYIVVLDRQQRDKMFVGQFAVDEFHQQQVLANLKAHRQGKMPAQGRLVNCADFRGFMALVASERLQSMARRRGFKAILMKELILEIKLLKDSEEPVEESQHNVYVQLLGSCIAVMQREDLKPKFKAIQLKIDTELADLEFFTSSWNDEMGRLFLETVSTPASSTRQIIPALLMDGTFYLPTLQAQKQVRKVRSSINALRAELDEIESAVWANPTRIEKEIQQLRRVNHEDTLETWMESLPFPLASILWRFKASNGSTTEKNAILLHFFEALAEFWATIYLSAAKSDREFWMSHLDSLDKAFENENLSFDRATFGLWRCVTDFFRKKFKGLLNDDPDRCRAMFRTGSIAVLEMLFDSRLGTVLQKANSIRNHQAHGGVTSASDTETAHAQLNDLMQTCRSVMGLTWEHYELIQPGECRFTQGVMDYKVKRVMGTRTPFATVDRKTIEGMDDGALHLLDPEGNRALKLLAFLRVMPSPKTEANACYFYNRKQADNQKFVSYHFEADSEIEHFFADTQADLEEMRPFGKHIN